MLSIACSRLGESLGEEKIFSALKEILSGEEFGCAAEEITNSASLRDDLGLDSLDHVALAMALEDALGVEEIGYDEMDSDAVQTVGQVVKMLAGKTVLAKKQVEERRALLAHRAKA